MPKSILNRRTMLWGFLPFMSTTADVVTKQTKTAQATNVQDDETGTDRLQRMFQTDEFGKLSPELNSVMGVACMSMFTGALYGGVMESKGAYMDFMNNNQATIFRDHLEAKKRLQDKVTLSFGKGAFKWGWRLTVFTTTYVGVSTSISTYRGKSGIIEHVLAGVLTGSLYKFKEGPRAALVGGGLGLVLGTIAGVCTYGLLSISGMSMDEVRYWQYKWKETRADVKHKTVKQYMEKEQLEMLTLHDKEIGESGNSLENLDKRS